MKNIVILYHVDCSDGFGAAWAAWKKFGRRADYFGILPSQGKDQLKGIELKNKEIYFLDVCAGPADLKKLVRENKSVTVIDHHLTNREAAKHASRAIFDLKHSGSVLAWQYFHLKKKIPQFLRRIEDIDLWRFRLPRTKEVFASLDRLDWDFKAWGRFAKKFENPKNRRNIINEGKIIVGYENELIKRQVENAYLVNFFGYKTLVSNAYTLHSETGNELTKKRPPIGITWYERRGTRCFSLRSNGRVDVSKLAKKLAKGGGHKAAAGFSLPMNKPFPWKIVKSKNGQ